jgi:hypothetical protein
MLLMSIPSIPSILLLAVEAFRFLEGKEGADAMVDAMGSTVLNREQFEIRDFFLW